jgi:hypothetical protein
VPNLFLISEHYDIIKWWVRIGMHQFPSIYVVARLMLALPDSNGHQERTFSVSQCLDDPLRKAQSCPTFEMKTLLYRNRSLLDIYKDKVSTEMQGAASNSSFQLVKQAEARGKVC